MRERITPSLVISIIALVVALGGASYAAIQIPKNSVGSKQLKKNAVTTPKLKRDAVSSAKVRNGALLRQDFKPGQLPGEAWYAPRDPSLPLLVVSSEFAPVVTTDTLPAGSYVLSARANVIGGGGVTSTLICSMENDAAQNFTVGNNEMLPLSMSAVAVLPEPGTISLNCSKSGGAPQIAQAHVIATRVSTVNGG